MTTPSDVKTLRELFNAATLMAGVCGSATAALFYNTQDPQILCGLGPYLGAGAVFGLWQMAKSAYHIKKQDETIYPRHSLK